MVLKMNNRNNVINEVLKNKETTLYIFDFDNTLTYSNSESSIGVFTKHLPFKYKIVKKIFDFFTDKTKSKKILEIIWKNKLRFLLKYYNENLLNKINIDKDFFMNDIIFGLFKDLNASNAKIIIYSSGLKEVIEKVLLKHKIKLNEINIIANSIQDVNKKTKKAIITPNKEILDIGGNYNYEKIIVFGDKDEDLKIIDNDIKILVKDNDIQIV